MLTIPGKALFLSEEDLTSSRGQGFAELGYHSGHYYSTLVARIEVRSTYSDNHAGFIVYYLGSRLWRMEMQLEVAVGVPTGGPKMTGDLLCSHSFARHRKPSSPKSSSTLQLALPQLSPLHLVQQSLPSITPFSCALIGSLQSIPWYRHRGTCPKRRFPTTFDAPRTAQHTALSFPYCHLSRQVDSWSEHSM